jgi:hypothetical protein
MCKEMPVIPINKVVDPKKYSEKMEGQGGGETQGVGDPKIALDCWKRCNFLRR